MKTDHKFTGQIEGTRVGLYWYASRAYGPTIGRFTVPDRIVPGPRNSLALNRYVYGLSHPLRYNNPTGHDPVDRW